MDMEVSLRALQESDIDDFMVWVSDDRVTRFCTFDTYTSREAGIEYIKNTVVPHPWFRAICLDNTPVGAISVTPSAQKGRERTAEVGYVLATHCWGRGIATEALRLTVPAVFGDWGHLERLEALVDVQNVGSQRVLEKVGFKREGVLRKFVYLKGESRDLVMFSFLSSDDQIMS